MNARSAQLITLGLAGVCGVMALAGVLAWMGAGRGYGWLPDAEAPPVTGVGRIDADAVAMAPESDFAEVRQRPIFNEDRKPTPVDPKAGEESIEPASPLNIALTGVILDEANHVRVAMFQDKARNQAVALKVGMPLEGEQASWTLVEVKPRSAVFRNSANETTEVELETALAPTQGAGARAAKPANRPGNKPPPRGGNAGAKGGDASQDLARRIEERRKQMREDAERLRNGGRPAQQKK